VPTVWSQWVGQTTEASQYGTGNCWQIWIETTGTRTETYGYNKVWHGWNQAHGRLRGARQASAREAMITRNLSRAHQLRRKIAERRARQLLIDHLDDRQRREYEKDRVFHVETANGRRRYKISRGIAGNITIAKYDAPLRLSRRGHGSLRAGARLCCHVYHPDREQVPPEDNMLAQALFLRDPSLEREFLAMANAS
jgi:hypothetical protein